jgi:N,N'-diacetyllegionaminate synthase
VLRGWSWLGVRERARPARANPRRSVVLVRAVAAGEELQREDLGFKRPGTGIPPFEVDRMIGRRASRDLVEGTVLSESDIE